MAAQGASAIEIVSCRTLWSLPFAAALVYFSGRTPGFTALTKRPRTLALLVLSATLIAINWSVYVWAVAAGRTLSASLGYYVNPLFSLAMGALFFKERVSRSGWIGVGLASVGVAVQALALHAAPWIPIALALSFGGYGVVRKTAATDAQTGLLVECLILAVPAAAMMAVLEAHGQARFGHAPLSSAMLFVSGPATVAPLAAFAFAARRLPLSSVGFLQFITPTLQFLCGLWLGERLAPLSLLAFAFIWAGALAFAWGAAAGLRRAPAPDMAGQSAQP
jgi:chloramphenicol-sensitive protein RarD